MAELDRVLGGGLVPGTVVLLADDPLDAMVLADRSVVAAGSPSGVVSLPHRQGV